jgi:ankyrin repeat protein
MAKRILFLLLIEEGANINAVAYSGNTPLDDAIYMRHRKIAQILKQHGGQRRTEIKSE